MLQLVKSSPEVSVHVGDVLEGRYRLQKIVGEGGMGMVFLAEHVLIKRRVAIKVLHRDLARDADVIERFMNEARAAGTLGHPNIVESTDMGFARADVPYIVFEYLEGALLSDEVYRLRGLPVRRALKIAHQIASALDAAHRAGIVHRDLKTDNVFLTDKDDALDHVKVLDFGISRFVEAGQERTGGTRRGVMMGTPEFMAPEQITAPESVDGRTDIYALGIVLYEMLCARTPFVKEGKGDPQELLHRVLLDVPPPIPRDDLPAGLADLIFDKLIAKDPEARFQTMSDVQAALEAFISVLKRDTQPVVPIPAPIAAEPEPHHRVLTPALPLAPRRRAWPWLFAALVVGAGATGLVLYKKTAASSPPVAAPASMPAAAASPPGTSVAELERTADQIGVDLDAAVDAAQLRAQGIATSPMLRAAIETDAATLQDLAHDGSFISPQRGEVLEIVQHRDGRTATLLRLPQGARAVPTTAQLPALASGEDSPRLVVSVPVQNTAGGAGGAVLLSTPIDVRTLARGLDSGIRSARLVGSKTSIVLVGVPGKTGGRAIAIHSKQLGELQLVVDLAAR